MGGKKKSKYDMLSKIEKAIVYNLERNRPKRKVCKLI